MMGMLVIEVRISTQQKHKTGKPQLENEQYVATTTKRNGFLPSNRVKLKVTLSRPRTTMRYSHSQLITAHSAQAG